MERTVRITRCLILILGLCLTLVACGVHGIDTLQDSDYPFDLKGTAIVTIPGTVVCTQSGSVHFVANADRTCAIYVTHPMTFVGADGKCFENGDTQAWLLTGKMNEEEQACVFSSCNDRPDAYSATGSIQVGRMQDGTYYGNPAAYSCVAIKNGKTQVSFSSGSLGRD